jgi:hypothetical protein
MLAVHVRRRPGPPGRIAALEQAEPPAGGAAVLQDAMQDRACDQVFAAIDRLLWRRFRTMPLRGIIVA